MKEENKKKGNVPNLRFPQFTGEWEEKMLGDISVVSSGGTPNRSKLEYWGGNIPWVSTSLIDFNTIYQTEEKITEEGLQYSSAKICPKGTLLMAMYGQGKTRGKVAMLGIDASINQACASIQTDKRILNSSFLFQNLSKRYLEIRNLSNQGGQENLSGTIIKSINVSYPSLSEQEKIVSFFILIDQRIEAQNKIIEQYKSLIKGIYTYLLGKSDKYRKLGEFCQIKKGEQINRTELLDDDKYYVMNGGITPSGFYHSYNTKANTISISEGGNSCGYVQYNDVPFWSGGHCYTLEDIDKDIDGRYLFHYLKANEPQIMALRIGSGLPNIQKKDLSHFCILMPSLLNQKEISDTLDKIMLKIELEKSAILVYQKQKIYLLQNLFI
ncbi:restriction endonuclease subunit S [Dysgonomonas macrotermitis]|uniref:Type I restriction enzyme, S subunit n=1 Tax=Dysgonomonas macrotermitis TaxID=1346286 RepID=A0A1M5JEQ6_9BACT|nr:restriction endonuclease subunit S [Dysgonomonas macrotermitis]SHG39018.1 type I restriction enzyme, S subunit [Dysgonomonas macrotermitis]